MAEPTKLFHVTIVTPEGVVFSHHASSISMKAIDGGRQILYNHAPILTPLTIGELAVKRGPEMNGITNHIAVNGGFIEFADNQATIVADSAERARNIDVKRAQAAKERAEMHLKQAQASHDQQSMMRAEVALRRAVNRINVFGEYHG